MAVCQSVIIPVNSESFVQTSLFSLQTQSWIFSFLMSCHLMTSDVDHLFHFWCGPFLVSLHATTFLEFTHHTHLTLPSSVPDLSTLQWSHLQKKKITDQTTHLLHHLPQPLASLTSMLQPAEKERQINTSSDHPSPANLSHCLLPTSSKRLYLSH